MTDALSLGARAASGVGWLTAQTWVVKAGGFATVIVLARLLTPTDFGLVAVAMTVLPIVYLISDLGFGVYLMQAEDLDRSVINTAFWYSVASSAILGVGLVFASGLFESLFGVPGVGQIIVAISPLVVIAGITAVPVALLRRGLRFRALAVQATVAALIGQVVAIALAVGGAGVWALVAQVAAAQVITLIAAWISSRWRPALLFSRSRFRVMVGFGASVLGVNAIALARNWGENAIITNILGVSALGQLSVAQRLVQTSQEVAGAAISPVSTVVFAQVRGDRDRLHRGYSRAAALSYSLITPALTAIAVTAPALVPFLFGAQWQESVPVAQALAIAAIFTLGAVLDHGLFYGLGKPGVWMVYAAVVDAATVAVTLVVARFGIGAVAWGFVAVAAAATIARWFLVARVLSVPTWHVYRHVLAGLVAAATSGAAGWGVFLALQHALSILQIAATGFTVLTVHLGVSSVVLPSALQDVLTQVRARAARRRACAEAPEQRDVRG